MADFAVVDGVVNASQEVGKDDDDDGDCRLWIIAVAMTRMTIWWYLDMIDDTRL